MMSALLAATAVARGADQGVHAAARDRMTYAMMLGMPVMQLLLFGYAINTDPRHLPTAVLVQENSAFARSIVAALENSALFRHRRPGAHAEPSWTR